MKLIIFGATGTIGRPLLEQALAEGHQVTAYCRSPHKLDDLQHSQLRIVAGDVYDQAAVTAAIAGHEAVYVVLGSGKKRKSNVRSQGTKTIIAGMQANQVDRLICQSTLGAGESQGNLNFFWKRIMFGWFLKGVFLDHELQESYVRASGLNWTIVRPAAFTDGKKTSEYKHGFSPTDRSVSLKISRQDVAHFLLRQTSSDQYLHLAPGLSY